MHTLVVSKYAHGVIEDLLLFFTFLYYTKGVSNKYIFMYMCRNVAIRGTKGTPYEGGVFKIEVEISER